MKNTGLYSLIIVIFLAILLPPQIKGQEEKFSFEQKIAQWSDFEITDTIADRKDQILIITNRPFKEDEEKFLPNEIAHWRKVSYFLMYADNNKWYITRINSLKQGLDVINDGQDLLLFVHGHGKDLPSTLARGAQVMKRYNVGTIMFDWPSDNRNFHKSLAKVRRCGENFYNLLLQLRDYRETDMDKNQNLSIFAHSLGNYFLTHLVVNGNNQYFTDQFIDNIILNAAAVKTNEHGVVLSQMNFQKNMYVVLNENDHVIRGAHLLMSGKMLGNFAVKPLADNVTYIDFTTVAGKKHTYFAGYHHFEYNNPAIFYTFNQLMHGHKPDLKNTEYYINHNKYPGVAIKPIPDKTKQN